MQPCDVLVFPCAQMFQSARCTNSPSSEIRIDLRMIVS